MTNNRGDCDIAMGKPDKSAPRVRELAVLDYPGAQQAAVLGLIDLLRFAAHEAGLRGVACGLVISHWHANPDGRPARTSGDAQDTRFPDALILPPALGELPAPGSRPDLCAWLVAAYGAGTVMASACAGAFLLAEAGLLDQRPATTHWAYDAVFRARFPGVALDTDRLLIDDGDIITAGGIMAWTDLGLRLVDRLLGLDVMLATARAFLIDPPGREQAQYRVFQPRFDHGDLAVLKAQRWLQDRAARSLALGEIAEASGLEGRTLQRRFRAATGMTPQAYHQNLRIAQAQDLLATTGLSTDTIAWNTGYADAASFRKTFARLTGMTPASYRKRIQRHGAATARD